MIQHTHYVWSAPEKVTNALGEDGSKEGCAHWLNPRHNADPYTLDSNQLSLLIALAEKLISNLRMQLALFNSRINVFLFSNSSEKESLFIINTLELLLSIWKKSSD